MRTMVLASLLGATAGSYLAPSIVGPVHYRETRPHSYYATLTPGQTSVPVATSILLDFVITDILVGANVSGTGVSDLRVAVNGATVMCSASTTYSTFSATYATSTHLSSGVLVRAGSSITLEGAWRNNQPPVPVTLVGYQQ